MATERTPPTRRAYEQGGLDIGSEGWPYWSTSRKKKGIKPRDDEELCYRADEGRAKLDPRS